MPGKLKINFLNDLRKEIATRLAFFGCQTPSAQELRKQDPRAEKLKQSIQDYDAERLLIHYWTIHKRVIPVKQYDIFISDTIQKDPNKLTAAHPFEEMLKKGESINEYLSHLVRKPNQLKQENLDLLLYEWGIYHIHLKTTRSNQLLFFYLHNEDVYILDILEHEDEEKTIETWTNIDLVKIIHNNWPSIISPYKVVGDFSEPNLTTTNRRNLREKKVNSFIYMDDGTTYWPLGGGYMAAGIPATALRLTDEIISLINQATADVLNHYNTIRKELNILESDDIKLNLLFDENLKPFIYNRKRNRILTFINP